MGPRSEPHPIIEILTSIAPWVWPATAAIIVGGLVVVTSLMGVDNRDGSGKDAPALQRVCPVDRGVTH